MNGARAIVFAGLIVCSVFAPVAAAQSNDVTWSGEVSLNGDPAVDGALFEYEISEPDSVSDFSVDITGKRVEQWSNSSVSGIGDGNTQSISAAGTSDPIGPASGEPRLKVTGHTISQKDGQTTSTNLYGSESGSVDAPSGVVNQVGFWGRYSGGSVDVQVDGSTVATAHPVDSGWNWIDISNREYNGGETVSVTLTEAQDSAPSLYFDGSATNPSVGLRGVPESATVSADDGSSASFNSLSDGVEETAPIDLSTSASSLDLDSSGGGTFDVAVEMQQVIETQDPTISINDNSVGYSGTLSDGETTSLNVDPAWIQEGTNQVNVSVDSPSGAPSGSVGLSYSHTAADSVSVNYEGETWSERYNVSKTYSDERLNASLRIPFSSDRVVAVRDAEYRVNGGTWSSIPEADRQFDGSTLVLDVGDVAADDSVAVRANGSKVRVNNGEITVLQPTTEGDKLDSEVQLDSWGDNSNIDVSETLPDNLHYVENASWSSPNAHVEIDSGGTQKLYLPSASSGSTARIATMPMAVSTTGDVEVSVETAGKEPTFDVRPGETTGDSVEWNYQHPDIVTGQEWIAYSVSNDRLLDSDTAESPILLETTDSQQTIEIREDDSSGSTTEGDAEDEIIGPVVQQGTSTLNSVPAVLFVWALIVAGMALLNEMYLKTGGSVSVPYIDRRVPTPGGWLTWVVSIGSGIFILEYFSSGDPISGGIGAIFGALGSGLSEVTAFAGIVAVVIGAWYAYRRWIRGQTTNIQVVGRNE